MRGLNTDLPLVNGKISLSEGAVRGRDAMYFYCSFDRNRIYTPNFGANFITLVQRPVSYVVSNKVILLGTLQRGIKKYVPSVKVKDIDVGYVGSDRKNLTLRISYEVLNEDNTLTSDVIFV